MPPFNGVSADDSNNSALMAALQQLVSPLKPLMAPVKAAEGIASNPTVQNAAANIGSSALGLPSAPPPPPTPSNQGVDQSFVNSLNAGTAIAPPTPASSSPSLSAVNTASHSLPSTDPSIYKNITSEDRAAMFNKLMAQRGSTGQLVASGVAGLGDAISNSFGGQHTSYQKDLKNAQNANVDVRMGAFDTQRQQKLQDLQASVAQQENDPNSSYSKGYRQFISMWTGKKVPESVSASMLKPAFPDIAKIFDAQLTNAAAMTGHKTEAGKELAGQGFWQRLVNDIKPNAGDSALNSVASGGSSTSSGPKHVTPTGISYTVNP